MSQAAVNPRRRYISACTAGCVLAALVTLAASAPASAAARAREVILVSHDKQISPRALARGARALQLQVNQDLRVWWPGPRVLVKTARTAGDARWRVTIAAANVTADASGIHGKNRHGVWARVYPSGGLAWTWAASHEMLEMLEDPSTNVRSYGFQREICDPIPYGYYILGDIVSDFVTPAYFHLGSNGPWDYLGQITTAPTGLQVLQGQP
ncbi:MAG TPA: hypothetical protein VG388_14010 [Solirubrobacteraceae bacterium]|nr:hypothetical protein [Solirubrobacteraceae bacterium]